MFDTAIADKEMKEWEAMHKYIYDKFNLTGKERILDVGCSYGSNLQHFSPDSIGIDCNVDIVEYARKKGLHMHSVNMEYGFNLDPSEKFDLIWSSDVLAHLTNPYKILMECRKHMVAGSRLMIQIPQYSPVMKGYVSVHHFYAWNYPTLKYLLESAGFKIKDVSGFVRHFPGWINAILEPALLLWGPNLWVLAEIDMERKERQGYRD